MSAPSHGPQADLTFIAFSKDRPAQLDLLLRSLRRHAPDVPLAVVYTAAEELHEHGYAIAREEHPWVTWVDERNYSSFREATLELVRTAARTVAFLVDDIIFTHDLDLDAAPVRALDEDPEVMCCSLRLDPGKTYCYALDIEMVPPPRDGDGAFAWRDCPGDWGYPMSIDGHIFRTAELLPLLETLDFKNPNTLEDVMARHPLPHPKVTCLDVARLINIPDNRVQDIAENRHAGGDPRRLTLAYLAGRRLDLEPFDGLRTRQVHVDLPLPFARDDAAPRVSVVIPCHDMAGSVADAIASVTASSIDEPVEVVVVDDGSSDDSAAVARAAGATVVSQPASGHPAHARNAGAFVAQGSYLLFLDADDRIDPDFLTRTVAALDADPRAGFAYGDERDVAPGAAAVVHRTPDYDFSALITKNFLGSATLVRRDAFEAVGGYDAEVGYEDWDLWIALGAAGRHGVKAEGAVFEHRLGDAGRWAFDKARDREIKARFVIKRPELYDAGQRDWAEGVLAGDATALAVADAEGIIPSVVAPAPVAAVAANGSSPGAVAAVAPVAPTVPAPTGDVSGLRAFAVLAVAAEIIGDPSLLLAHTDAFAAGDDVTLVLWAPEPVDVDALEARLESAGLGDHDVLLVADPQAAATLAERAGVVLSARTHRGPLALRPAVGADGAAALRLLAERAWHPPVTPQERFDRDLAAYQALDPAAAPRPEDLFPKLEDWLPTSPYDQHYFFQDVWAARRVADAAPARHVDVGSRVDLVGFLTALTDVTFVDIRPLEVDIEGLTCVAGSVLDLPFADRSLESVSCLHVAEHIGLGRYGDPLDPLGTVKAAHELQRVVAPGGQLLFSGPVGRKRVCFNAHRVHDPVAVVRDYFPELELVEFSGVDDRGVFRRHRQVEELAGSEYACGMFLLRRPLGSEPVATTDPAAAAAPVDAAFEVPADMAWAFPGGEFYERDVTRLFDGLLAEAGPGAVYDIGANCGWFAVRAARGGRPVRAFEPVPGTAAYAERNLAAVSAPDAELLRVAVSDRQGIGTIHLYSSSGNNSLHERTLPEGHPLRHVGTAEVPLAPLDALVAEHGLPAPALVKIDVEGNELAVLRGARETLRRHRPLIVLEWAETTSNDAGHPRHALVDELRSLGYEPLAVGLDGALVDPATAGDECESLVARPA